MKKIQRERDSDSQYDTKEERRVITGSEAKTAQANGEVPKGYIRQRHTGDIFFRSKSPVSNTPMMEWKPVKRKK
jgi:hypothetical protein